MGFRFHKSWKLLSGIRFNLSKSGPSVSVGGKGLTYNFGTKRDRATVGLPGTGMSYQTTSSGGSKKSWFAIIVMVLAVCYALFTAFSDGKFSIAHWPDLFSGKKHTVVEEETPAEGQSVKEDNGDSGPTRTKRHRTRHAASYENPAVQDAAADDGDTGPTRTKHHRTRKTPAAVE